jgi:MFS family permease
MPPLRRNRDFVALWIGQGLSNLGISISSFAYPLVVLEATGSAVQAGLVGSVLPGTTFVLRIPAGALVDRWRRRWILIGCDLGRAVNSGVFAVMLALGHFSLAQVLVVAVVEGALGVLFGPAESAAVRHVVPREQLRDAVALNQSRAAIPALVGPPLGGVLLGASRALPFVADAASYLASLGAVLSIGRPLQEPSPEEPEPRRRFARELLEGLGWIWERRFLRALLLWFTGAGVIFNSIGLVALVLARDRGASSGQLGVMFAVTAAGGLVGALIAPRVLRLVAPQALVPLFAGLATAATFLLVPAHSPYLIGALGAVAFLLVPSLNALATSLVVEHAPDRLLGRATSASIQLASLGAPIGPVLAGAVIGAVGVVDAVAAYGCAYVVLTAVALAAPALRADPGS